MLQKSENEFNSSTTAFLCAVRFKIFYSSKCKAKRLTRFSRDLMLFSSFSMRSPVFSNAIFSSLGLYECRRVSLAAALALIPALRHL